MRIDVVVLHERRNANTHVNICVCFSGLSEASAGYRPPCPDPLRSSVYEAGVSERSSLSHAEPDLRKIWMGRHWREGGRLDVGLRISCFLVNKLPWIGTALSRI